MTCDLFVFAGEKSGDLLGGSLLKALLEKRPSLQIFGVGGPLMRAQGIQCILPMEQFQVMGFLDVLLAFPRLRRQFYTVAEAILRLQPRAVVTIDYPGFNLRLARYLKKKGFNGKLIHLVCPSVWAWGKKRIALMEKHLDLLLCILPFEPSLFDAAKLSARFVGHPLTEILTTHVYKPLPFHTDSHIFALFPGSRKKEILRNLPFMLDACEVERGKGKKFHVAISVSEERFLPLIEKGVGAHPHLHPSYVPATYSYELMQTAHLAIAKSGTVTLELACHHTPTLVVYAVSLLDRWIAYYLLRIRLPFYCLVNIIAGKEIFPEFIGPHLTTAHLVNGIDNLLQDDKRKKMRTQCHLLRTSLSNPSFSSTAAAAILSLL